MRSVMFGKLNASRSLFPKFQMAIYAASDQEVLILSHGNLCYSVPVHEALLIHLRAGQCSQVSLFMLKYLQQPRSLVYTLAKLALDTMTI